MKKAFLFALLAAGTQVVQAQNIPAGTVSLGGSIGYSRNTSNDSRSFSNTTYTQETSSSQFDFSPSLGYFVADNLAIGINAGYSATRRGYTTFTPSSATVRAELDPTTNLRLGVFGQYYKMLTEQFGVLGTLGVGYQSLRDYSYSNNGPNALIQEDRASGYYADLTPGIIFFPIPKLGLNASIGSLGFNRLNYDYPTNSGPTPSDYKSYSTSFGASFGLSQLLFGGTYYFGR